MVTKNLVFARVSRHKKVILLKIIEKKRSKNAALSINKLYQLVAFVSSIFDYRGSLCSLVATAVKVRIPTVRSRDYRLRQ